MNNFFFRNIQIGIVSSIVVTYIFLFFTTFSLYQESKIIYTLFSLSFLVMFLYSFRGMFSYAYLFITFFLVLGFFVKLSFHLLYNYPYIEPVGSFYTNNTRMDDVLILAIIGSISIVVSKIIINLLIKYDYLKFKTNIKKGKVFSLILRKNLKSIWLSVIILTIILALLNIIFNIQQIGIVPKTILIWPLNAVIFWFLITGVNFLLAFLMQSEKYLQDSQRITIYSLYLIIASFCSISILSRGQFVYTAIAFLIIFMIQYSYFNKIKIKGFIVLVVVILALVLLNTQFVTLLRNELYGIGTHNPLSNNSLIEVANFRTGLKVIQQLFVDRWLGLEGLMAVVSYEYKDFNLFLNEFLRNPKIGDSGIFNTICNAHYKDIDLTTYNFTALAGFFGFLYFSGSKIIFIILIMFFILLVLFLELLVKNKLNSEYIRSFFGMFLANAIVAMSGLFSLAIKFWFLLAVLLFMMYFINSRYFDRLYLRLKR